MQLYERMDEGMKERIRAGRLETITPEDFATFPTQFFLLISVSIESHIVINVNASTFTIYK